MTSFGNVLKLFVKPRFKRMSMWLLIEVIAIIVTVIIMSFQEGYTNDVVVATASGAAGLASFITFIMLAVEHEKAFTQDVYRSIPISDAKLYLSNMLGSFIISIYFLIVQVAIIMVSGLFSWRPIRILTNSLPYGMRDNISSQLGLAGILAVYMLTLCVLGWTTVTLAHFILRSAQNFLPSFSQRLIRVALNIVLVVAMLYLLGKILNGISDFDSIVFRQDYPLQTVTSILSLWVIIILESVGSVYLLHRWVETVA